MDIARVLQFADSTLPVGAFSFSNGLESAVQCGVVHDVTTLREFVRTATRQVASADGIALLVAHRAALASDLERLREADQAVLNRKLSEEMRTMSVRMGKKLAELVHRVVPAPLVTSWLDKIRSGAVPGTYPVVFGLALAVQGVSESDTFAAHQYGVATMMLGAALRLMRLAYLDGQAILYDVNAGIAQDYVRVERATLDDMATFAPVADILSAAHVTAHMRLFMS
ncbi:MAG: ureF [Labilithrix sp.]|nr:ureF [Labilithrix sp.]